MSQPPADAPPRVSVLILTYNHEPFVEQALASALMQRTSFPIEILVGEDCSTDGTRRRLLEISDRHPGRLQLRLHNRNLGAGENLTDLLHAARGDYIALLEGDDYWTNPDKLQRQVEALDAHPGWAVCFHRVETVDSTGRKQGVYPERPDFPVESSREDLVADNFIATVSVMFRHRLFPEFPREFRRLAQQDWPLHLLNSRHGSIGFLDRVMAAYRMHGGGVWTRRSLGERLASVFDTIDALEDYFGDELRGPLRAARKSHLEKVCRELEVLQQSTSLRVGQRLISPLLPFKRLRDWFRREPRSTE